MTKAIKRTKEIALKAKENYYKPTPKLARKIGDTILGLGTSLSAMNIILGNKWLALGGIAFTYIGKTLTNFWSE